MSSSYTYLGDEERYYPDHGVFATPGATATFDGGKPDDLWVSSSSKKAAAVKDPDPAPVPAADTTPTA